jgi:hypothetical protein
MDFYIGLPSRISSAQFGPHHRFLNRVVPVFADIPQAVLFEFAIERPFANFQHIGNPGAMAVELLQQGFDMPGFELTDRTLLAVAFSLTPAAVRERIVVDVAELVQVEQIGRNNGVGRFYRRFLKNIP